MDTDFALSFNQNGGKGFTGREGVEKVETEYKYTTNI